MLSTVNLRPTQLGLFVESPRPRLYDHVIEVLRLHHYSLRTEEAYVLNTGGRGVQSPLDVGFATSPAVDRTSFVPGRGAMLPSGGRLRNEHGKPATENSPEHISPQDITPISAMRRRRR